MPSPSRSNFTSPIQAQSSLSHWMHRAVLHAGVLDRHDLADGPVGEHHAAGVDAEVPREAFSSCVGELDDLVGDVVVVPVESIAPQRSTCFDQASCWPGECPSAFAMSRTAFFGR